MRVIETVEHQAAALSNTPAHQTAHMAGVEAGQTRHRSRVRNSGGVAPQETAGAMNPSRRYSLHNQIKTAGGHFRAVSG